MTVDHGAVARVSEVLVAVLTRAPHAIALSGFWAAIVVVHQGKE